MSPQIPALQSGGHTGVLRVVQRLSEFLHGAGKKKKKKSLVRGSEAGFKGQGWRRCPAHTGAESPPQPPKAPPRGWGPPP